MRPTNQETTPTGNEHYEALEVTIKSLKRGDLESIALRLAELYDEQDKTIKGHEELADQLLPLIKAAYPHTTVLPVSKAKKFHQISFTQFIEQRRFYDMTIMLR